MGPGSPIRRQTNTIGLNFQDVQDGLNGRNG